jgi:methionine aminopeptidase
MHSCHGIPDSRALVNGDVLKIDTSLYFEGFHGDCCGTFFVGEVQLMTHCIMKFINLFVG